MTKEFFKENAITYREFNVASDLERRQEMVEKSGGMAVPVIDIDGKILVGFDKDQLEKALELA